MSINNLARQSLTVGANVVLVVGVTGLILADLVPLALLLVVLSKWQVLLGGWRQWWGNLKSNACDIIVGLSFVALISLPEVLYVQLGLAAFYLLWLLAIKPQSSPAWVGIQALICQFLGLSVIFLFARVIPSVAVLAGAWAVAYIAAWHFLSTDEEVAWSLLVVVWALLVAELSWLLNHWLITYSLLEGQLLLPQASVIITVVAYCVGRIYLDHRNKRLGKRRLVEYILVCFVLLAIIIAGTPWDVGI